MKKYIAIIILAIMPFVASADSYTGMWKKVTQAQEKDLPKSELLQLAKISKKAKSERQWGQLIKSEIYTIQAWNSISPDSLAPYFHRFEAEAVENSNGNDALAAVYDYVLGYLYQGNPFEMISMNYQKTDSISQYYFAKAIANPDMLAKETCDGYEPLILTGKDSKMFNNDLLHVIGFETNNYEMLSKYYDAHGNRPAACYAASVAYRGGTLAQCDSLINRYSDLVECGELAVMKYKIMSRDNKISAKEKIEFIDEALQKYASWPRIVELKTERNQLTVPQFSASISNTLVLPGKEIPVNINSLQNITTLNAMVTRLNATGTDELGLYGDELKEVLKKKQGEPVFETVRHYSGHMDYESFKDSLTISPLTCGTYLLELSSDNKKMQTAYEILRVSNVALLDMDIPSQKVRLITVDATTGSPLPGATIHFNYRSWNKGKREEHEETVTTDENGEALMSALKRPSSYRVTSEGDEAMQWRSFSVAANDEVINEKADNKIEMYTDRSIYRPKQTVQVSVIAYNNKVYRNEASVIASENIKLTLQNARNKVVDTLVVKTDEWGVAAAEFQLPDDGNTGYYTISAIFKSRKSYHNSVYFRVEEYKRPAFTVSIDDYKGEYKAGDTITILGYAKTYAGVPVQGAKVKYYVKKSPSRWWARYCNTSRFNTSVTSGEIETNADGSFTMRVPMQLCDEDKPSRWNFTEMIVSATVTDQAGESHDAKHYFPLSSRSTAFIADDFKEKQCKEDLHPATFRYINSAGSEIQSDFTYAIDGGQKHTARANEAIKLDFSGIKSGEHALVAICHTDTITEKFTYFSLEDKTPAKSTEAWYYCTSNNTNGETTMKAGEAIRLQVGTSRDSQTVFYDVVTRDSVLEGGSIILNNENINRSFTYKEEWGDGIAVRWSWICEGKIYSYQERLHKPEKDRTLKLEWSTFRDCLQPGQNEEWTISVKNPDGTPAKAHMIATIYDKSLDAFSGHSLSLNVNHWSYTPSIYTAVRNKTDNGNLGSSCNIEWFDVPSFSWNHFDIPSIESYLGEDELSEVVTVSRPRKVMVRGSKHLENRVYDVVEQMPMFAAAKVGGNIEEDAMVLKASEEVEDETADVQARENLNETATFLPHLVSDGKGQMAVKFTVPESLTTWQFLGLAHDKELNIGNLAGEAITQKPLMLKPNMPRFIREGDNAEISATIANTTDKVQSGTSVLQLLDPATLKPVYQQKQTFSVPANQTRSVTFNIKPSMLNLQLYICKITAKSKDFSDGEQQYLPILSKKETVVTARAITQTTIGQKTVDLNELFGKNTSNEKVSIEYTNNPAWMMVDALPAAVKDCKENDNAINYSTAIYSATIAKKLKDQGVSALVDADSLADNIHTYATKLAKLQNVDGSFSWWPDMPGSGWITLEVARNLVRLNHMFGTQDETADICNKAMSFLAGKIAKEVKDLKKWQKEDKMKPMPSELAMDYLYLQSIREATLPKDEKEDITYLLTLLKSRSKELSIYGKANLAVAFAKSPVGADTTKAEELIESLMQYSVWTEEMGRYFDTSKALSSWRNYKIPTVTAAIEALLTLRPQDTQSVAQMRQWLLNEKRTQLWDTPLNTTSAIYAFLNGNLTALDDVVEPVRILLDGKTIQTTGKERGYFKGDYVGHHNTVVFYKRQDGMSFGAVHTEALQSVSDVADDENNALHVTRELLNEDGTKATSFKVGQKVRMKITIKTDRDMDFIEVVDNRPACLEPLNQLTGYHWGYYCAPGDTKATYYFKQLAKGRKVSVETDYYVDRAGEYESGLLTMRCTYAPEFTARQASYKMKIEK